MVDVNLDQTKHLSPTTARNMCMTSAFLSWLSCFTAQWAIFDIAVYSFQAMSEFCSRCCCSLVRKRNLIITIICQVLISLVMISVYTFSYDNFSIDYLFALRLQDHNYTDTGDDAVIVYSRRERITEIFGRCAWAQSNGFSYCTDDNQTAIRNLQYCSMSGYSTGGPGPDSSIEAILRSIALASVNTGLTTTCAFLYLFLCRKLRARAANVTRSEMHKLQLRLSLIVLLTSLCWIPVTLVHWVTIFDDASMSDVDSWSSDTTAASVLLVSISPAANPLIYTFTGKNFLLSIRKFCRRMKCHISGRRNSSNYRDDHISGTKRCSCIPWVKCVNPDKEIDPDDWRTEDTSDWNSDQNRLLPSIHESSETI